MNRREVIKATVAASGIALLKPTEYALSGQDNRYEGEWVSLRVAEDQNGVLHLIDENTGRPVSRQTEFEVVLSDNVGQFQQVVVKIITDKRLKD